MESSLRRVAIQVATPKGLLNPGHSGLPSISLAAQGAAAHAVLAQHRSPALTASCGRDSTAWTAKQICAQGEEHQHHSKFAKYSAAGTWQVFSSVPAVGDTHIPRTASR